MNQYRKSVVAVSTKKSQSFKYKKTPDTDIDRSELVQAIIIELDLKEIVRVSMSLSYKDPATGVVEGIGHTFLIDGRNLVVYVHDHNPENAIMEQYPDYASVIKGVQDWLRVQNRVLVFVPPNPMKDMDPVYLTNEDDRCRIYTDQYAIPIALDSRGFDLERYIAGGLLAAAQFVCAYPAVESDPPCN